MESFLSGIFQKYNNEFFAHRKGAKGAEKRFFCSAGLPARSRFGEGEAARAKASASLR